METTFMEVFNLSSSSTLTMSTAAILATGNGLLSSSSSAAAGGSSTGSNADQIGTDISGSNKPVIEINTYLYIPFICFVFGAPLLFIGFLCYLQHRSKQLHRREWERLNNRRLSTQSGIYTGRAAAANARTCQEECL